ncbi:MAG TPA: polymer-forming cytoskeletal protein [Candidatus Sulfotelmatobacter sp.]|nr:polymer-forming cytoskeletal protein [Candidatus Sulfotelmatobacter sp.]
MWNKQQNDLPGAASQGPGSTVATFNSPAGQRVSPSAPASRSTACLGASIQINGKISGEEDLQIDGKVEGPISLQGQRLTVGRTGQLNSEIIAREVVVYGKVSGNLRARDRVEIKKDGSVVGDITTARISIEDGAYFKGRIEIERAKSAAEEAPASSAVAVGAEAN